MNFEHIPDKRLITGVSGTGKTTLYIRFIRESRADYKFIFDHEGELSAKLRCRAAQTLDDLNRQTLAGVCVFDPSLMYPGRLPKAWNFFCDYVFSVSARLKGTKLIGCDELQKLTGTNLCPTELCMVLETGRRYGIDFYCISQSPNLIHTRIRNQITRVYTFQQIDERALRYLEQTGFDADAVRALPPGLCAWRDLKTGRAERITVFRPKQRSAAVPATSAAAA